MQYAGQISEYPDSMYPTRGNAEFMEAGDHMSIEANAANIGMFNIPQQDLGQRSPAMNLADNLNYKQVTGMNATHYSNQMRRVSDAQYPSGSGASLSTNSQYSKPKIRGSMSNPATVNPARKQKQLSTDFTSNRGNSHALQVTDVPIYQLLKAFKLQ